MGENLPCTCQKKPNPQGKGVVPVLEDWESMQGGALATKSPRDFIRDYCISSLILSAAFRFKPVVEKTYFLYATGKGFSLSLVAPHEWGHCGPGEFIGCCRLRVDMTWEMEISSLDEHSNALSRARSFVQDFFVTLANQGSICKYLPFYVEELPYYQRMLTTAMASSLQSSLPDTGDDVKSLLGHQLDVYSLTSY